MTKILACIFMLLDHVGKVFFPDVDLLQAIGRMAFPLFAYHVALGIRYTSDSGRYFLRLLLFGLIAQPFYMLVFYDQLNILFLFSALVLLFHLYARDRLHFAVMLCAAPCLQFLYGFEYGFYGVCTVLVFYAFEDQRLYAFLSFVALNVLFIALGYFPLVQINSIWAFLFIPGYMEFRLRLNKYFYYAFYPAHLVLLLAIGGLQ
jgi:hypothetical protein